MTSLLREVDQTTISVSQGVTEAPRSEGNHQASLQSEVGVVSGSENYNSGATIPHPD
jgi:hypothetical protein